MSTSGRRPPFRQQTLGSILLRLLRSLLAPQPRVRQLPADVTAQGEPQVPPATTNHSLPFAIAGVVLVLAIVASAVILVQIFAGSPAPAAPAPLAAASSPLASPSPGGVAPAPAPLVVPAGSPLVTLRSYGSGAGAALFAQPQEAVRGPDGLIYVADTGNHRVAVLDQSGKLVRTITRTATGALLSPFGLAITPSGHLFVLDSDRGQVIEYAAGRTGSAVPLLASDTVIGLVHARDLALDAAGHILVADPASNSVVTLAADLTLLHQQPNRAANGVDLFEQPDAVAAGPNGSIYVVDSQNNQLKQYSSGWTLLRSWPLIATDTLHAPHVLPLSGGRVLVSDPPDGKLLLFTATSNLPRAFTVAIQPGSPAVPLGLARSGPSTVLVTCNGSNQVLEVRVAGL